MTRNRGIPRIGPIVILLFTTLILFINPACDNEGEKPDVENLQPLPPGIAVIYPFSERDPYEYGATETWTSRVFIACPHGSYKKLLLKAKTKIDHVTASPDGKYLAIVRRQRSSGSKDRSIVSLLSLVDGEHKDVSSFDPLAYRITKPVDFSPDGGMIVFSAEDASVRKFVRMFIYDMEDNELHKPEAFDHTMTLDDNPPQFASNGWEILCMIKHYETSPYEYVRRLIAYDVNTDTYRELAEFSMDTKIGVPIEGPEGKYVYFDYIDLNWTNHRVVNRVPYDGGTPETIFEQQHVLYIVGFEPEEGKALLSYHIIRDTRQHYVATGNCEDGEVTLITKDEEDIKLFPGDGIEHLSPDKSLILVHYHDLDYDYEDIMVMGLDGENRFNVSDTATHDEAYAIWIDVPEGLKIPVGGYVVD